MSLVKISAPFVPFITDEIYQNLVVNLDKEAPASVHLCLWPEVDESAIDKDLEKEMDLEYITKYQTNPDLPKDTIRVIQEGNVGSMQKIIQKEYLQYDWIDLNEIDKCNLLPVCLKDILKRKQFPIHTINNDLN